MADLTITGKIKALLRKADASKNSSEAEARAAMDAAQRLMTKHGIDQMEIMSLEDEQAAREIKIEERVYKTGRQRYETDQYIARILRTCFNVRILWGEDWQLIDSPTKKWSDGTARKVTKKRLIYHFYGVAEDTELAEEIVTELHPMMRHLLTKHLRERGLTWNAVTCHSFFDGLTDQFIEINRTARKEVMLEAGETAANQYALVLQDKAKAAEDYITNNVVTVRARSISGPRSGQSDQEAYDGGKEKGKSVKVGLKKLE